MARQKAKDAATAAKKAATAVAANANANDGDDGEAAGHVMLSYNWGHQDVIKRINTALKARGYVSYSVWIDIEKMQGSTVEAMADAVEDAAVVCYGISQAYKESTNCRMEAQYAFQQQKDMVPLMLEEDLSAKGVAGDDLGCASVVWVLRDDVEERGCVRGQDGGTVSGARGKWKRGLGTQFQSATQSINKCNKEKFSTAKDP